MNEKIKKLHPAFQKKADELIKRLEKQGYYPKIVSGYRSEEEQLKLYKEGKSKVRYSFHNAGLAIDVVDKRWGWNCPEKYWWDLGTIAKELGLYWGGEWNKNFNLEKRQGLGWDPAHVQLLPNSFLSKVRKGWRPQ